MSRENYVNLTQLPSTHGFSSCPIEAINNQAQLILFQVKGGKNRLKIIFPSFMKELCMSCIRFISINLFNLITNHFTIIRRGRQRELVSQSKMTRDDAIMLKNLPFMLKCFKLCPIMLLVCSYYANAAS